MELNEVRIGSLEPEYAANPPETNRSGFKKKCCSQKVPPPPPPKHFQPSFSGKKPIDETCPKASRIFFSFMSSIVALCHKQCALYVSNIHPPSRKHLPKSTAAKMAEAWNKRVLRGKEPNLLLSAIAASKKCFWISAILILLLIGIQIGFPVIINTLSIRLDPTNLPPGSASSFNEYLERLKKILIDHDHQIVWILCGVVVLQIVNLILESALWYILYDVVLKTVVGSLDIMINKMLTLSDVVRQNSSSNNLTNLLFADTMRISNMLQFLYYYITIPIIFIINTVYLGVAIGPVALAGFIALILFMLLFYHIIVGFSTVLISLMSLTDARVSTVTEVLNGIKVIKLFTAEEIQHKRVMNIRIREIRSLKKFFLSLSLFSILGASSAPIMTVFAFVFMSIFDSENFTAQKAYTSIYMFRQLGLCFVFLPGLISFGFEASISAARIRAFLLLPTLTNGIVSIVTDDDNINNPVKHHRSSSRSNNTVDTNETQGGYIFVPEIKSNVAIQSYYNPSFCHGHVDDGIVPPLLDSTYDECQRKQKQLIKHRKDLIMIHRAALSSFMKAQHLTVEDSKALTDIIKTAQLYEARDKEIVQIVDNWCSLLDIPVCSTITRLDNYFPELYAFQRQSSPYHRLLCISIHVIVSELLQSVIQKEIQYTKSLKKAKHDPERVHAILLDRFKTLYNGSDTPITLHNLDICIEKGELVGIYGPVGSGKTTLFAAILGELRLCHDSYLPQEIDYDAARRKRSSLLLYDYNSLPMDQQSKDISFLPRINISGRIAYFTQTPTIFSGTVRDNILFYRPYDEQRYRTVCDVCCLVQDLLLLEYGDMTAIGDKGISLSGGQKARIALARALYSDADVLLLDDPLSAVDAHVGQQLWHKAILGYLRERHKTVLISSHQTQYFHDCDRLIEISYGKIVLNESMTTILRKDSSARPAFLSHSQPVSPISPSSISKLVGKDNSHTPSSPPGTNQRHVVSEPQNTLLCNPDIVSRAFPAHEPDVEQNTAEETVQGSLSCSMYNKWLRSGTHWRFLTYLIIPVIWQIAYQSQYILINKWTTDKTAGRTKYYIVIYTLLVALSTGLTWATAAGIIPFLLYSCKTIFSNLITALLYSPMSFYDVTPLGRILNRLSKDMESVDMELYHLLAQVMYWAFEFLGLIVCIAILAWPTVVIIIPIVIAYIVAYCNYRTVAPQLKRLEGITKSPIFNICNEVLASLQCVRAYKAESNFLQASRKNIEVYSSTYYMHLSLSRWFIMQLNIISTVFAILIVASLVFISPLNIFGNFSALIISYCFSVQMTVSWCVTVMGMFEAEMTSVERVLQYTELPSETITEKRCPRIYELAQAGTPWPRREHSGIHVSDLRMRYRQDLSLTLKGCNFDIMPGEHIGVVGRTGAGKSSLTTAFFRLAEPEPGSVISIDGVNILTDISLKDARQAFAIIPQDPFLFSGTLRQCLCTYSAAMAEGLKPDPGVEKIPDDVLWRVLEQVRMREYFEKQPGGLDARIAANGDNLSAGQRQLVCVARAFIRGANCVVLDEATAQVDQENDRLIQTAIRESLADTTIFSIAHRLDTIIDFDKILVVDAGKIAEYDTPANLLRKEDSIFSHLVANTGEETAKELRKLAFKAEALRQEKREHKV